MGALGRLGSAAKGIRFQEATGAQDIVQLGMAFGIDPRNQRPGDVLVSSSLIPYDNRTIMSAPRSWLQRFLRIEPRYIVEYSHADRQPARPFLVELFFREQERGGHPFDIHVGAILSGARGFTADASGTSWFGVYPPVKTRSSEVRWKESG